MEVDGFNFTPGSYLVSADYPGINLQGVDLSGSRGLGVDFSGANLSFSNLHSADFSLGNLSGVNLTNAWVGPIDLQFTTLNGANLKL